MKAISLLQPWATLVVTGAKKIETRSWSTPYRGTILIHASLGKRGSIFSSRSPFNKYIPDFKKLPFGAIVGEVSLVKILRIEDLEIADIDVERLTLEEKAFGDYSSGRYGWVFENPVAYNVPVPARGHLKIWEI